MLAGEKKDIGKSPVPLKKDESFINSVINSYNHMVAHKIKNTVLDDRINTEAESWGFVGQIEAHLPIHSLDIPHFVEWINFNRFADDHRGLDLAAYVNKFGEAVLGLPERTAVHAVADGIVIGIERHQVMEGVVDPYDHYFDTLVVAHGKSPKDKTTPSLLGIYAHVTSTVKEGQYVSKGQKIGKLYADLGNFNRGRLVHLHFGLANYDGGLNYENPEILFPNLMRLTAHPQRHPQFTIVGQESTDIRIANFRTLQYGDAELGIKKADTFSAPPPTYSLLQRIKERLT